MLRYIYIYDSMKFCYMVLMNESTKARKETLAIHGHGSLDSKINSLININNTL